MSRPFRRSNIFLKDKTHTFKKDKVNFSDEESFPLLGSSVNSSAKNIKNDYSQAVKTTNAENLEESKIEIPFGWVHAKRKGGRITVDMSTTTAKHFKESKEAGYIQKVDRGLNSMVVRWQNERDELNDLLGPESPYWDSICLFEMEDLDDVDESGYISNSDDETELEETMNDDYLEEEYF